MSNLFIAICIGLVAGAIDVIPMIIMKLNKFANTSAFVHYFVLGCIIPFLDWGINPVLTGLIVSFLTAVPFMIMVFPDDKRSIIPMTFFSVILGAGIGWAGSIFIIL